MPTRKKRFCKIHQGRRFENFKGRIELFSLNFEFLNQKKDDLKWLDNHPDSDHLRSRISRSRIIHALSRLENFHSELFIDPINPNLGKKLSRQLLSIFNQLPSTKLLSDEDLFTPCVKYFTGIRIKFLSASPLIR